MIGPTATSRRALLAAFVPASTVAVAGCLGDGGLGGNPDYERGTIDADGDPRNATEMSAAQGLAETNTRDEVTPLDTLDLVEHRFVLEDGYLGATIQGTVENTDDDRLESAEVRTRVYDEDENQLGRYVARTGDLEGNSTWSFQVVVLESPADLASYDVAAFGTPS